MRKRYILAFYLLLMIAVGVFSSATVPSNAQFPPGVTPGTNTGPPLGPNITPTITLTPTPPLTPLPTSSAPGCATSFPIALGSTVTVRGGVNIRTSPSPSAPWLANFPEPRNFIVVEGPICNSNFIWWRFAGQGVNG